jgi:mRNA interferase RelE/StbE
MKLLFTKKFLKQVSALSNQTLQREIEFVIENAEKANSLPGIKNIKKLKGHKNYYRIRIGDYRIGLYFNNTELEFSVFYHRKDIYKYFP